MPANVEQVGSSPKPVQQSLYIDLVDPSPLQSVPIQLGWRLGIEQQLDLLTALQAGGVNHVAINLRFNQPNVDDTLERLADKILPYFSSSQE